MSFNLSYVNSIAVQQLNISISNLSIIPLILVCNDTNKSQITIKQKPNSGYKPQLTGGAPVGCTQTWPTELSTTSHGFRVETGFKLGILASECQPTEPRCIHKQTKTLAYNYNKTLAKTLLTLQHKVFYTNSKNTNSTQAIHSARDAMELKNLLLKTNSAW